MFLRPNAARRRFLVQASLATAAWLSRPGRGEAHTGFRAGEAAFFWFDSRAISENGEPFYGAYAYRAVLRQMSPKTRPGVKSFAYFDGDRLGPVDVPHQGETEVASRAQRLGSLAYTIAIYAYEDGAPFREVDAAVRRSGTVGYLGITTTAAMPIERFVALTRRMALPVAMKQEGAALRIVSLGFMSAEALRQLGFEPDFRR